MKENDRKAITPTSQRIEVTSCYGEVDQILYVSQNRVEDEERGGNNIQSTTIASIEGSHPLCYVTWMDGSEGWTIDTRGLVGEEITELPRRHELRPLTRSKSLESPEPSDQEEAKGKSIPLSPVTKRMVRGITIEEILRTQKNRWATCFEPLCPQFSFEKKLSEPKLVKAQFTGDGELLFYRQYPSLLDSHYLRFLDLDPGAQKSQRLVALFLTREEIIANSVERIQDQGLNILYERHKKPRQRLDQLKESHIEDLLVEYHAIPRPEELLEIALRSGITSLSSILQDMQLQRLNTDDVDASFKAPSWDQNRLTRILTEASPKTIDPVTAFEILQIEDLKQSEIKDKKSFKKWSKFLRLKRRFPTGLELKKM